MSSHRFYHVCDIPDCGKRSEDYAAFHFCTECLRDLCADHVVPGSAHDDERMGAICHDCMNEAAA